VTTCETIAGDAAGIRFRRIGVPGRANATKAEADGRHRESVVASRHLVDADGDERTATRAAGFRHRPPVSAVVQPAITLRARLR
jgi:hypothetical protein